jgi:hypothetical protein
VDASRSSKSVSARSSFLKRPPTQPHLCAAGGLFISRYLIILKKVL